MTEEKAVVFDVPKNYEELDFTDDFLFCKILTANLDLCRELLEIIMDIKIRKVKLAESQKSIKITRDSKSVRLDVYVEDETNTVYDIEMQVTDTKNLPKRSRYYQGMIDLNLISKGENYKKLKKSYIIFICKFDPFGDGLCRYTFENRCNENPSRKLEDESIKVFINPYGKDMHISKELRDLLDYLQGKESESSFVERIKEEVEKAKEQKEWRVEYMTLLMREQEIMEQGMERGRIEGRREGLQEGMRKGHNEGRTEERHQIIVKMLKRQIPIEQIADVCSATIEEVEKIKQEI